MWYVYFLQLNSGDVYLGSTNDLRRRFESHRSGYVTSTKAHLPLTLKAYIAVEIEDNARQLERYFKTGSSKALANKRFWPARPDE
ncbi:MULTISPECIES: GIY-YIG nuclease family protein [unclassified Mesorhizobium]|uniref:GIY-YIG nuclease family protein n=1 Tax=unclassified Mesorhizobium TaxID=325217 RepID=UPI000BAFAD0A|nr:MULTISPECIES: GIY-YIG nuclease family protein [unclassified Mesorhizobium]PBB87569.1 excinuclease ABC subunit C [Mesorhizobium sp. WSM3876]RWB74394.1 MAG: excinuclease ABC subunit C [Mesorhizobium sp.]RWB80903.1 MAG: excinuclease ABC subunit C [Mesorhizobium sp.]RWE20575.1 MAG: excinuclease ABC subunit C [Mesorhizobium sp.]RWE27679.1 MAG: excinuclease ABC subunit C [Mesorhizobium sp.]